MANKVTKRQNFVTLRSIAEEIKRDDLVAFIDHEIELLDKKAQNKSDAPTVRQKENAKIMADILSVMQAGKAYRCSEVQALIPELAASAGTQRTARLLTSLMEDGKVVRSVDKKVVYFALAD